MTATTTHATPASRSRGVSFFAPHLLQAIAWLPTRLLLNFFCDFTVGGLNNIREYEDKALLLMANHDSELDAVVVRAALPMLWKKSPLLFVTAPLAEFHHGVYSWRQWLYGSSWFFSSWGAYPIVRKSKSYEVALATHQTLLQAHNSCVLIFPEGRRSQQGMRAPLHGGAGFLAHLPEVYAVPVAIHGLEDMTFVDFIFRRRSVHVEFGVPLFLEQRVSEENENPNLKTVEHVMQFVYTHLAKKK